jgi:hypothetical protein
MMSNYCGAVTGAAMIPTTVEQTDKKKTDEQ